MFSLSFQIYKSIFCKKYCTVHLSTEKFVQMLHWISLKPKLWLGLIDDFGSDINENKLFLLYITNVNKE
jgi:hypothetical protein